MAFHREAVMHKREALSMACLRDIFGLQHEEPFYAGFGNRITGALSCKSVNVPGERVFTE